VRDGRDILIEKGFDLPPLLPPVTPGVYAILCLDRIKIGVAKDVRSRMSTVRTNTPYPVFLLLVLPQSDQEHAIHARFKHLRVGGEWFTMGPDLLQWIADARAGFVKPPPEEAPEPIEPIGKFTLNQCTQYARDIGIRDQDDWFERYDTGLLDSRAPGNPRRFYGNHWPGWPIALGHFVVGLEQPRNYLPKDVPLRRSETVLKVLVAAQAPVRCAWVARSLGVDYTVAFNALYDLTKAGLVSKRSLGGKRFWQPTPKGLETAKTLTEG
jgi:hypothetical protein